MQAVSERQPDHVANDLKDQMASILPALRAFSRTFFKNPDDADDLVQETLRKALGSIHQFTPGTSMKSWLFTIMRNTYNTAVRLKLREVTGSERCISENCSTSANQEWVSRARELQDALHEIHPEMREVIILVSVMGSSYEEAAEICGCAIGTIKSRLNRGKAQLLEKLGGESRHSILETPQQGRF
ncbi:hypothetical protein ATN84_05310 [Paramesorhizobium deserti]|uniref:RNA polymerase sigma factor n=1 Tax=Paramesorhizobium deserti TaxID=1494590 RepID=A0A135I127_9HYPH|nr:sigma-70 family RNA polymerase sigma factor [Paramesorhizobium deserti]KXF79150.1 hypothetical protein ATN84_05310 [Paramesorhizobium deserti]